MRKTSPVQRKECFTAEEVTALMELLPDDRMGWSIRLLLGTGMRTQELLALEPRHIEPDGSSIHIRQAINMLRGTAVVGTPKSRDSYRHTYVSQMQALGVDLATIQSIVGHADIDMTQHYLHVQESIRQDAIARFSRAFSSETTDPDNPTDGACKVVQFPRVG